MERTVARKWGRPHANSGGRVGAGASTRCAGRSPPRRSATRCLRARAMPASPSEARCVADRRRRSRRGWSHFAPRTAHRFRGGRAGGAAGRGPGRPAGAKPASPLSARRPSAAALEGSKGFMKDLCARHGIPTAAYARFTEPRPAKDFIRTRHGAPIVVKADGLAAGKGVVVADDPRRGPGRDRSMMVDERVRRRRRRAGGRGVHGRRGGELLRPRRRRRTPAAGLGPGPQARRATAIPAPIPAAWAPIRPAPPPTPALEQTIMDDDHPARPCAAMAAEGRPFKGVLFAGLMFDRSGPKLLEYNVRFGDPECQVLCMRLEIRPAAGAHRLP